MNQIPQYIPTVPPGYSPEHPVERLQPIRTRKKRRKHKPKNNCGCLLAVFLLSALLLVPLLVYLLLPLPINFVVLGIDRTPEGTALGRSDTIILVTTQPLKPYVGMLSVPRDLWVYIPYVGENRINTAHFFAEGNKPGSGPQALLDTIATNFQVSIPYYVRFQFEGFKEVVNALGGVTIELETPTGGYDAGVHHLDADQALAFVRDRAGSDDFFRMQRGQIFIKSVIKQVLLPQSWIRLPQVITAVFTNIDTNLPVWHYPRIGFAVLRTGIDGIDNRTITRDMVTPFTTSEGANVLLPVWQAILPVVNEMFSIQ